MSDKAATGRPNDDAAHGPAKAKSDSQLRLVTEDDAVAFPNDAAATDEAPTIISKNPPALPATVTAIQATSPEALLGSLRGRKLAHFELLEAIGVGGMAAVLRARDAQLDRNVALKILPPDMANDGENVQRFHQEARAAAKLDHENIARVFFCGEDQNLHFIAFEYVEGENLRTILERRGRLPVAEAVRYILQIATGLEHAAARGVVHRDVKPSNIIVTPTGRAKLVDMGLARNVQPQTNQLTHSGMTLGTYDYISPEQALEPREADARSDIYSLGCTFYHMLTGQAPVPEGTAAKKLHHHQHVAPIDPRQLNPEVPDEIALILGKMMAKNPKDRYQRPVQLVQHLMQVAQKVGAAADLPEGVMFVDAPLFSPPRKRPLLMVSVGALALATVLMVLSLAPPNRPLKPGSNSAVKDGSGPKDSPSVAGPKTVTPATPTVGRDGAVEIASEQDLIELLADKTTTTLKGHVVGSFTVHQPSLVFQAAAEGKRTLILEGKADEDDKSLVPAITWKFDGKETGEPTALLQLEGAVDATFNNLQFKIETPWKASKSAETMIADLKIPKQHVAAVAIHGGASVRFVRCLFDQVNMPWRAYIGLRDLGVPLASVLVHGALGGPRPHLDFLQCVFKSGQVAVGLQSPAVITAKQCAFRPHGAMFHLHGDGESNILLEHCSAFVVTGPMFRLDDTAACKLKIDYSIFSCPDNTVSDRDPIHLIHQTDGKDDRRVKFEKWRRNCYHNLNGLMSWPTADGLHIVNNLEEFRTELASLGGSDLESTAISDSINIWARATPHIGGSVKYAFKIDTNRPEVFTADLKTALGIEKSDLLDLAKGEIKFTGDVKVAAGPNLAPNEKVVDPTTDGKTPGVYETVSQALGAIKSGEATVIYIKHGKKRDLDVQMTPLHLQNTNLDVTLRPYEGFNPILTLDKTRDANAYFFRLHDGKMAFENLEIELEPDQEGFNFQTLALLDGNASCRFKNCVLTLKQNEKFNPSRSVPLSIIRLGEIDDAMMKMGTRPVRAAAEVVFENCFIRGEGDVISNRAGRAVDVRLEKTMVGLTGSLVNMQSGPKDALADAVVKLSLFKSSFLTTEPLLLAKQNKNAKLPPLRVESVKGCLFAALEDKPLVVTEYPELSATTLRNSFDWKDAAGNAYSGFSKLLEDNVANFSLSPQDWKDTFYKDTDLRFVRATFQVPSPLRELWLVAPDAFKPKTAEAQDDLRAFGAPELDQLPPLDRKVKSE